MARVLSSLCLFVYGNESGASEWTSMEYQIWQIGEKMVKLFQF
jgi:hypothetical protein